MDLIYVLGPVLGAIAGGVYGGLINGRVIVGAADWVPTYVILGALWGLSNAAAYRSLYKKEEDREKGEFLTETKAYKKKSGKKKDKVNKSD